MNYKYNSDSQLICADCNCLIDKPIEDRHGCYWKNLEDSPIGMLAMILRGQFERYNPMEQRISLAIWERVKEREKPKKIKHIDIINTTNLEVYNTWVKAGDQVFE